MNIKKIKPCPLCKSEANAADYQPNETIIECIKCGCSVSADAEYKAIKKWNTRKKRAGIKLFIFGAAAIYIAALCMIEFYNWEALGAGLIIAVITSIIVAIIYAIET